MKINRKFPNHMSQIINFGLGCWKEYFQTKEHGSYDRFSKPISQFP